MRGEITDGNRYIRSAIERGAVAVISDTEQAAPAEVGFATVAHGRRALAHVAAAILGHPERKLAISGVTGTNGKTTTAFLLDSFLNDGARKTVLIGTIEYRIAGRAVASPHTTPESLDLLTVFAQGVAEEATEAVMEVSSHALDQGRVWGIPFDVAMFTNLTRDHLDYHKTMDAYFAAKRRLFEGTGATAPRVAVINADDEYGAQLVGLAGRYSVEVRSFGVESGDFRAEDIERSPRGTAFTFRTPHGSVMLRSRLIGDVNVYNLLGAATAAHARGLSLDQIAAASERARAVPGRFERVDLGQPFAVVVDYAHTDDALRNLIRIARGVVAPGKRVITVFGCGGDRDRTKRALMGRAAGEGSDFVVVTSDNPRSEDPDAIIREILPGLEDTDADYTVHADRRAAIRIAVEAAQPGDIVLLAGKGHEKTQTTRAGVAAFDDVEEAKRALAALGFGVGASA